MFASASMMMFVIVVVIMIFIRLVGIKLQNEWCIEIQCDDQFIELVRREDMAHLFHCSVKPVVNLHEIIGGQGIDHLFIGHVLEQAEGRALGMIRQDLHICGQFFR